MKNITKLILGLVAVIFLTACGGSGSDENQTTPVDQEEVLPTCSIEEGIPLRDNLLTVHIVCNGGNVHIDEARVSTDGQVKNVDINDTYINDYINFANLDGGSHYTINLEVIVGGETLLSNVTIKTSPSPSPNQAPKWTANSYDTGLTIEDGTDAVQNIINLKSVSSDADGDTITYSIVSVSVPGQQAEWSSSISISSGVLIVKNLKTNDPNDNGQVTIVVKATATGGSANTSIKFNFNDVQ